MINAIIWHDNGKAGQIGYTEESVKSHSELDNLLKSYEAHGILIYSVDFNSSERV